ncbi:putative metal-binding protein [Acidovorax delafieldii]|uniref:Metal-binding protein n=1 Tax=Acidovorax delafieldii TaxID=47920 RepID=A0AAJ2C0F2_ACIDE|nr:hypothetical protein [Acidovorax delafieldii]MDR6767742.1 putative metal-binding protein [Acidovorax delafieldii]MDR6839724.1 putative metal-binding protein [Acidovorax delafieldii]MDR7368375.1 putative metal-binding protein [Acidovorax delafieldii]
MRIVIIGLLVLLAGCETAPRVEIQRVNMAVPVACQEKEPERPVMPTEALRPGATVDQFTQAAQAEIERREGYEVQLVAALAICTRPVDPAPAKAPLGLRAAWPK